MDNIKSKKTAISAWWFMQGVVFTAYFITAICRQDKPPVWAMTFGIILLLAAYLRLRDGQLKRIADMVLLAYAVSFAIIAGILACLDIFSTWFVTMLTAVAVVNIAACIVSLWRKKKKD